MERFDAAIVGAGVVGLAVAERLSRERMSVAVLEAHPRYGMETSSRNSEVIHAGLYYPPESLKNRLCREGRRLIYALSKTAGVFARRTGKLVVATGPREAERLESLRVRAEAAGAEGLRLLDGGEVSRRIPWIKAEAALWSPESGIVDSEELMRHFHGRAQDQGAVFVFGARVSAVERLAGGYRVAFGEEALEARLLVNAAGLSSDKVAAMAGIDVDAAGYRLRRCKGSYFRHRRELSLPHLVYPLPGGPGLGIHLTPDRAGRVRLGPDAEFVEDKDYAVDAGRREAFRDAARRYWPDLKAEDLLPDTAGIRPKLSGPEGGFRDFVVAEESGRGLPGLVNLVGIESPGLTAAPAIAEMAAGLIAA